MFKVSSFEKLSTMIISGFFKLSQNKSNYVIIDSNNKLIENKKKVLSIVKKIIS